MLAVLAKLIPAPYRLAAIVGLAALVAGVIGWQHMQIIEARGELKAAKVEIRAFEKALATSAKEVTQANDAVATCAAINADNEEVFERCSTMTEAFRAAADQAERRARAARVEAARLTAALEADEREFRRRPDLPSPAEQGARMREAMGRLGQP